MDAPTVDMAAARRIYELLETLEGHVSDQDKRGRAVLYQAKEQLRKHIIDMDRSAVPAGAPEAVAAAM